MKIKPSLILIALLGLSLITSEAQPRPRGGGGMGGPGPKADIFAGGLKKLLGENKTFSANMEIESPGLTGATMKVPGKIAYNDGKSRMEMDMTKSTMPEEMMAQIKAMSMDLMIIISRPDKKVAYMIYPGLKSYAEMPLDEADAADTADKYKLETNELGKETISGQACTKNKIVITDDKSKKTEITVWVADALKKFPVKIESTEKGQQSTILFKDVKFAKPDDSQFAPPSDYKKYESFGSMMQEQMMKMMGGAGGPPK